VLHGWLTGAILEDPAAISWRLSLLMEEDGEEALIIKLKN